MTPHIGTYLIFSFFSIHTLHEHNDSHIACRRVTDRVVHFSWKFSAGSRHFGDVNSANRFIFYQIFSFMITVLLETVCMGIKVSVWS